MDNHDLTWAFHFAEKYIERGWSILPVKGKQPLGCWKHRQTNRMTIAEARRCWGVNAKDRPNMAIVTGRVSDLTVVDLDSPEATAWWKRNRPETPLSVQTRRGVQFYYRFGGSGNMTKVCGMDIDIRGEGGYVVAPPSIHPISGQPYRWIGDAEEYSLDAIPVFDPAWIAAPAKPRGQAAGNGNAIHNVRAYCRKVIAVSGQGGHNATFRVACKLRDAGLSELDALAEMILWNEAGCAQPPWELKDLVHKVRDAYRRTKNV